MHKSPPAPQRSRLAPRKLGAVASLAALVVIGLALLATAGRGPGGRICAGQCSSPFELQVIFKRGTSSAAAAQQALRCRLRPEVQRVESPRPGVAGLLVVPVYTRDMGKGPKTDKLLSCLAHQSRVEATGWPD